jgi:hypothetical protein
MNDETQRTAQNAGQTLGAGAGPSDQPTDASRSSDPGGSSETSGAPIGGDAYDDDGILAQQTPGLDPEPIRRDAGPDWPAGTKGDLEADTSPGGGSGSNPSEPGPTSEG